MSLTSTSPQLGSRSHLGRETAHHFWDRDQPPMLVVEPGEEVSLGLRDGSNGQITAGTVAEDLHRLDPTQMDPLTGPLWVQGAMPGDVVTVDILDISLGSWGWSGILPGFGLLADQFPGPYLRGWHIDGDSVQIAPGHDFRLLPMLGVVGVAPPEPGRYAATVPTDAGGNIDVKYARTGSRIHLPVFVEGALLSLGDAHALQGDGELSGTAIECEADVVIRVGLVPGGGLLSPVVDTGPLHDPVEPSKVFLGVGPDLMQAAKAASTRAVDGLADALGVEPQVAYALLGTIAELRIMEVVDRPNWVVGCMLPSRLFG
jgi:acetamidase/formamidase